MDDNNSEDNNTNMNFNEMPQFAIVPNQNGNTININHVSNVVWNLLFDQSPIHSPQVAVVCYLFHGKCLNTMCMENIIIFKHFLFTICLLKIVCFNLM